MNKQIFIVLGVCLVIASCQQLTNATDFITQPTAKEIYARDFEDADVIFNTWTKNFEVSKNDSLKINLPYLEQVQLHNNYQKTYLQKELREMPLKELVKN